MVLEEEEDPACDARHLLVALEPEAAAASLSLRTDRCADMMSGDEKRVCLDNSKRLDRKQPRVLPEISAGTGTYVRSSHSCKSGP